MTDEPRDTGEPDEDRGLISEVEEVTREAEQFAERARSQATYGLVLVLVFVSVVFDLAAPDAGWSRGVSIVLSGATLLITLWVARAKPRTLRTAAAVIAIALVASITGLAVGGDAAEDSTRIVNVLFIAATPAAIMRDIFRYPEITLRTVFGVLAVYLLIGLFFAALYTAVASLTSGPFFAQGTSGNVADRLYFSFVTITTTGYGDYTPATRVGRSLAVAEALIGQLYLVTLVSLIVGNLGRTRRRGALRHGEAPVQDD
ncbi:MAG: ion channel [Solirubrobacteraceae bacterium]